MPLNGNDVPCSRGLVEVRPEETTPRVGGVESILHWAKRQAATINKGVITMAWAVSHTSPLRGRRTFLRARVGSCRRPAGCGSERMPLPL